MNATERRIRELQRIAYGADAADDERAAAIAELDELARSNASDAATEGAAALGVPETTSPPAPSAADSPSEPARGDPPPSSPHTPGAPPDAAAARRRLVRWTAAAASVGLLVGGVLGWSTAQRVPSTSISSSRFGIVSTPQPGVPLDETRIPQLFDRLPVAAEAARIAAIDDSVDPESVRAFDGADVCLVLAFPTGPFRRDCTTQGIFPLDGLSVEYGPDGYGLAVARLSSAGTVSLGLIVP